MYPFPPAQELQRFAADIITHISLHPYSVQFMFESEYMIQAEQRIEHLDRNGTLWTYDCQAQPLEEREPVTLHRLLYRSIKAIEREDLRLTFRFDDASALAVLSELGPYESGSIRSPEGAFVVF